MKKTKPQQTIATQTQNPSPTGESATLKTIIQPLLKTIIAMRDGYPAVFFQESSHDENRITETIHIYVDEQRLGLFSSLVSTLMTKGGLRSHLDKQDTSIDPLQFSFRTVVQRSGEKLETLCFLDVSAASGFSRSAARRQASLLRYIISDRRNLVPALPALTVHPWREKTPIAA